MTYPSKGHQYDCDCKANGMSFQFFFAGGGYLDARRTPLLPAGSLA